jgi:hypothetical protein
MKLSKSYLILGVVLSISVVLALIANAFVLNKDKQALITYNAKLESANEALLSELASLQGQIIVKEQAYIQLRESLDNASQQSLALQRQLDFYKLIMSPDENKKGLSLYEHYFSTQTNKLHLTFINIDKKQKTYAIGDLLPTGESFSSKLSFKYFDTIEQRLVLPDGFHPEKLALSADLTKKPFKWNTSIKLVSEK